VRTISAGRFVAEKAEMPGYFPRLYPPKAASIGPLSQKNSDAAYKAGVNIAFGTDCGVCPHGSNAKELLYLVEGGVAPMTAIQEMTLAMFSPTEDVFLQSPSWLGDCFLGRSSSSEVARCCRNRQIGESSSVSPRRSCESLSLPTRPDSITTTTQRTTVRMQRRPTTRCRLRSPKTDSSSLRANTKPPLCGVRW